MGKMYKSRVRFQFTPLREGRRVLKIRLVVDCYFNSRPSARGDIQISILFWRLSAFQFTSLREGRRAGAETKYQRDVFQFTPLREGRQCPPSLLQIPYYFNSRPSARGDLPFRDTSALLGLFQFTPLREGRLQHDIHSVPVIVISIHAPPRGATICHHLVDFRFDFNSRPSARGDLGFQMLTTSAA